MTHPKKPPIDSLALYPGFYLQLSAFPLFPMPYFVLAIGKTRMIQKADGADHYLQHIEKVTCPEKRDWLNFVFIFHIKLKLPDDLRLKCLTE